MKQTLLAGGVLRFESVKPRQNKNKQGECKAKVKVDDDRIIAEVNEHTHSPEAVVSEVLRVKDQIRTRATQCNDPPNKSFPNSFPFLARKLQLG